MKTSPPFHKNSTTTYHRLKISRTRIMEGARRSSRISRRVTTTRHTSRYRLSPQHELWDDIQTTLIHADSKTKDTTTSTSDSSPNAATDPSIPPSNGTCHLMGPSAELRLAVAEHIFEDFFTRFNLGLYPPFFTNGESKVPYTQELFTVLQTNHSFRLDTINLCNRFATRSAEEVVRLPPGDSTQQTTRQSIRSRPHKQLKSRHKKILKILRKASLSMGDAQSDVGIREDIRTALFSHGYLHPHW